MATADTGGASALHVTVISPEETVFDGDAEMVVVPAWDGEIGILRGHAPLMAILGKGELRIKKAGDTQRFELDGGFVQVVDNVVTVLSEHAGTAA